MYFVPPVWLTAGLPFIFATAPRADGKFAANSHYHVRVERSLGIAVSLGGVSAGRRKQGLALGRCCSNPRAERIGHKPVQRVGRSCRMSWLAGCIINTP